MKVLVGVQTFLFDVEEYESADVLITVYENNTIEVLYKDNSIKNKRKRYFPLLKIMELISMNIILSPEHIEYQNNHVFIFNVKYLDVVDIHLRLMYE